MPTHSPAPPEVKALIADRIASGHYPDLEEAEVAINALMAFSETGPAVKYCGQPWDLLIKGNSAKARLQGLADATLTIDGAWWADLPDAEKEAAVDRELHRLVVCRHKPTASDPSDHILSDDAGRPRLKQLLPDIFLAGYSTIARRHGDASPERRQARTIRDDFGQLLWAWDDDFGPSDEMPASLKIG
jgi:hypothetical protein